MYHKHISDDLGFHTNYVYLFLWLGKGYWLWFPTLIGQALLSSFLSLFLQFPSHTTASYNGMWWDVAADCITSKTVLYLFIKGLPEHKGNIFKFFKFIYIKVALGDFSRYFALYLIKTHGRKALISLWLGIIFKTQLFVGQIMLSNG